MWHFHLLQRVIPYRPRRYRLAEMELRLKELQIMLFCLVVSGGGVILNAALNSP